MSPRLLSLCLALLLLTFPALAAPHYSVTDLGILPGGKYVYVTGINNRGQVVGWVKSAHIRTRGFLWSGRMQDLGKRAGYPNCKAFAINDHSQIIGQDRTDQVAPMYEFERCSFLWENGRRTILPLVKDEYHPKGEDMAATAINNRGQVVGGSGFLWQNSGEMKTGLFPVGINDKGQVAGQKLAPYASGTPGSEGNSSGSHPFLWKNGALTDLGLISGAEFSEVSGINAQGQTVGWMASFMSASGSVSEFSFLWDGGRLIKIGNLKGYNFSQAHGINAQGQVVGKCVRHRGYAHAYCWQNGEMTDLNSLIPQRTGWVLEAAYGINDQGQIIGVGTHNRRSFQAFLLTPQH